MPEPESAAELFTLEPAEFTAARNALVKKLKFQNRATEAAEAAAVRKPPLTAWALNQVARNQKDLVDDVLRSGQQLRQAMSSALEGDRSRLADAREAERTAIESGVEAAVRCLEERGHPAGDSARRKMTETLRSATVDDSVAGLLERGVIDTDKASIGFGFGPSPSIADQRHGRQQLSAEAAETTQAQSANQAARERKRILAEIDRLIDRARSARQAADRAQKDASRLSEQAEIAGDKLAEAKARLEALVKSTGR